MILSPGQKDVFDKVMAFMESDDRRCVLAGYAGTGKTTLAKVIADEIDGQVFFCAFTGKAANVLKSKDCQNADTIHHYLYALSEHDKRKIKSLENEIWELRFAVGADKAKIDMLSKELEKLRAAFRKPKFALNEANQLRESALVIVDEYSMLSDKIIEDMEKSAKKVLYIGDPFQLPPVQGECSLEPNLFLTEIHRQAMDSAIIRNSKIVREGGSLKFGVENDFSYLKKRETEPNLYTKADQLIVGRNNTRTEWNKRFRRNLGHERDYPVNGDKIICLKNNREADVFNGMIGKCVGDSYTVGDQAYVMNFDDISVMRVWEGDALGYGEKYDGYDDYMKTLNRFDYGYAITCHKSQGSEFDNVVVYNEPIGREDVMRRRWLYTALTRSKKQCTLVQP